MKVWQELLQRLRNGEALEVIRRDCRSDSQFAKAIRIYNDEMSSKAEKIRKARLGEEQNLTEAENKNKRIRAENSEIEKEGQNLRIETQELSTENQRAKEIVDTIKAEAESLEKAGFTSELMEIVKKSWVKNGNEALSVLRDLDRAVELRVEVQNLSAKEIELKRSLNWLETKHQKTSKKLVSEKNQLDVVKAETSALQKVVKVVEAGLRRGYTPEEMIGIFVLLEMLEIQKQPELSIKRLVESIGVAKNLSTLKAEEVAAEKQVEQLHVAEVEMEKNLELQNSCYLESLEDVREKGKEAVASVADLASAEVGRIVSELADKTRVALQVTGASMLEQGKLMQLKSTLEPQIGLLGLPSQADLAKVSPGLVALLLENVSVWLEQRFPNATVRAWFDCGTNKFVPSPVVNLVPVVAYLKVVMDSIKELTANESKNNSGVNGGEK